MSRRRWVYAGVVVGVLFYSMPCWIGKIVAYSTGSMPPGWYVRSGGASDLQVGDVVVFDVPATMAAQMPKDIPAHRLLKRVAATAGMVVCWTPEAMTVTQDGQWLAAYRLQPDRPLGVSPGCTVLPQYFLVVVGTHPRSFDSRYVGPIDADLVQFRVRPVWTWEAAQ